MIEIDVEGGSISGYVVDAAQPQIENYLSEFTPLAPAIAQLLRERGGPVALLRNMSVDDECRGQGIGTTLLERFLDAAADEGAVDWLLVCDEQEQQAPGFDLSAWYERYEFETAFEVGGGAGLLMARGEGLVEALRQLYAEFECEQSAGYSRAPAM